MATLQKIRNHAALLIIVVGGALLAFIIGDGLRSGSTFFQLVKNVALTIDGERVPIEDFGRKLSDRQRMLEQNGNNLTDDQRAQISNQLAQEYIDDYVLKQEADKLGVRVTGAELSALIYGQGVQSHYLAQQFLQQMGIDPSDVEKVKQALSQLDPKNIKALPAEQQEMFSTIGAQWSSIMEAIVRDRLEQKISSIMARSYVVNKVDAKYLAPGTSRDVLVVRTPSTIISDKDVKVSDADIKKYYETYKERFKSQEERTSLDLISVQIRPSASDYAAAQTKMQEARSLLAVTSNDAEVARNYDEQFVGKTYFTATELDQLGLSAADVDFIKTASVGAVNSPVVENDHYSIIKLTGKKSAPETVRVGVVVLDSVNIARADSLAAAINAGASFAQMVKTYSVDPSTKEREGVLEVADPRTGMPQSVFTENQLLSMGLDTLFRIEMGKAIVLNKSMIVRALEPAASVEKYRITYIGVPAEFSKETSDERYAAINGIFSSTKDFGAMIKTAREKGLNVMEDVYVTPRSASLGVIPSSHEVVRWALGADKGDVHEKIFRCGDDYLVIAKVVDKIEAGYIPLNVVKDNIKDLLLVEKRAEKLVADLQKKNCTSLEQYASVMNSSVDTLNAVTVQVTGRMHPSFNGYAMSQKLNTISKPFVAGTEVMVVSPIAEKSNPQADIQSTLQQQQRAMGQQLGMRAISKLKRDVKVKDNRYRFY